MEKATIKSARETAATYKGDNLDDNGLDDAYLRGFDRGYSCANNNDLPEIGETIDEPDCDVTLVETSDDREEVLSHRAYAGEETGYIPLHSTANDRSYSPFEFTAEEFNDADERLSEALWEAFDQGIGDGIAANVKERMGD